jgi:hypothetical protein
MIGRLPTGGKMANLREGSRRIKVVGQLTTLATAIVAACVIVLQLLMPTFVYLVAAVLTFAKPAIAGFALWATGWIMEGFHAPQ